MSGLRSASLHSSPAVYTPVPISTLPFYRRLLFPTLPQATPTPPIFAHGTPELNIATYELLAVILRSHVSPWYTRLTKDKTFVPEIATVIVHVLREVERRALAADLPLLLYTTSSTLLAQHYADYRAAQLRHALSPSTSVAEGFHALQPHIALTPESTAINPEYLRQAVEFVLRACMTKVDWQAETERTIVREILVNPVLGGILPRLAQPWFLFGLMLSAMGKGKGSKASKFTPKAPVTSMRQMLVLLIGALHSLTSALHSVVTLMQSISRFLASLPTRKQDAPQTRYYASNLLVLVGTVLDLSSRLVSGLLLSYISIIVALLQPLLDRILSYVLYAYILTPAHITTIVIRVNAILFPNGVPAPPTIEPPHDEQVLTRQTLEARLVDALPSALSSIIIGPTTEARTRTAHDILQPLSDAACNVHLVMRLLDAILLSLFPELAADSPAVPPPSALLGSMTEEAKLDSDTESNKEGFATPLSH
ncbi:hypothetical protein CALCODRAFT_490752 [Calocera cornea HHB12733]|uniref:PXA domain-containing protein n=1 Tax=Calocera cornea HHB12733 TaxID=1353952 RepID=A0A165JHD6_9BASI|nr:hypothetical protein CALCODRAFT_490752 [Calocera cornea HHB12733]